MPDVIKEEKTLKEDNKRGKRRGELAPEERRMDSLLLTHYLTLWHFLWPSFFWLFFSHKHTEPLIPLILVLIFLLRTNSAGKLHPDGLHCHANAAYNSIFLISAGRWLLAAAVTLLNYKLDV